MLVFVEQRHIDKGRRSASTACPITLALSEQTGLVPFKDRYPYAVHIRTTPLAVRIGYGETDIDYGGPCAVYKPSEAAVKFMADFDNGHVVKPCVLELIEHPCHLPFRDTTQDWGQSLYLPKRHQ